jgi:SAM-dependent methyltransferase
MDWYKEWFNDEEYLSVYSHRDNAEAQKLIDLILQVNKPFQKSKILDLACGNGRHSIELAKKGFCITGVDLSEMLLNEAKKNRDLLGLKIDFIQADMRNLNIFEYFDGAINLFTSFGYFEEDIDNEKVIAQISNSLKNNGWFVIDFFNSNFILNNFTPMDKRVSGNLEILQNREIRNNRIIKTISIIKDGIQKNYLESVRLYKLENFEIFFKSHSLTITHVFGDYNGSDYTENSERMIIFGRKES